MTKLCKDCKFFDGQKDMGECEAPGNVKFNYVTGADIYRMYPQDLREIDNVTTCGPNADWFKEVQP